MVSPAPSSSFACRPAAAAAVLAVAAVGCATFPLPAHAFWGLLGKAASGAGKAAGSAAGKTAGAAGAAGAAGEAATAAGVAGKSAATLADEAARAGGKAEAAGGAAHGFSAVNAALPPEVAAYLAKPAASLTGTDTAAMMGLYERMVAQAGKTGDFSVIEHMPQVHGAKTLQQPAPAAPLSASTKGGATATPAAPSPSSPSSLSPSAAAEVSLAGVRLLAHAASAGHRAAQNELRTRCADPAVLRTAPADVQASCKAALAAQPAPAAKPRPAAS